MWKEASWLGVPRAEIEEKKIYQGDMNGRFALYRLKIELDEPGELVMDISANSRYRLWINAEPVLSGPCRSSAYRHYYDRVDVSRYLRAGVNVFAVQVLLCDGMYTNGWLGDRRLPLFSVEAPPAGHRLAVEGVVRDRSGSPAADVTTGRAGWKVWLDHTWYLVSEPGINDNMGALTEHIDFTKTCSDWKSISFDDTRWKECEKLEQAAPGMESLYGLQKTLALEERPIPLLYETPGELSGELGRPVMGGAESVTIGPNEHQTILFAGDTLLNGYFRYQMSGGAGAELTFTYFEKFTKKAETLPRDDSENVETGRAEVFRRDDFENVETGRAEVFRRDDFENGEIGDNGQKDRIIADGSDLTYEPFWYHTMRFLQVEIQTREEELVFYRPRYLATGYPLHPESYIRSGASWVEQVYTMCVRTLQACMTDAYMDCPFWEQMQYPMDTRLQALFTYACSRDTALARKALLDFHDSMLPMGLIQGHAPSNPKQVISTFSLHYIFMLLEYYKRTGDAALLRQYRSDVDAILEYYDRHVGGQGLVENLGYWDFVDWQENWKGSQGRPGAAAAGPSTIINLMYGKALLDGAEICGITGRPGMAKEYRKRQKQIADRIQALCWDKDRNMYREGPSYPEFTQHAQSWAVLCRLAEGREAAGLLRRTFEEPDVLQCGFSTCFELFRACETAGCYELTRSRMEWWIHLLDEHCVTCPETPVDSRSECHGWSALPMYELLNVIAGIRRETGNPKAVTVRPHMGNLPDLEGAAATEYGSIEFRYSRLDGCTRYEISLPEGMTGTWLGADGELTELKAGKNIFYEKNGSQNID